MTQQQYEILVDMIGEIIKTLVEKGVITKDEGIKLTLKPLDFIIDSI